MSRAIQISLRLYVSQTLNETQEQLKSCLLCDAALVLVVLRHGRRGVQAVGPAAVAVEEAGVQGGGAEQAIVQPEMYETKLKAFQEFG